MRGTQKYLHGVQGALHGAHVGRSSQVAHARACPMGCTARNPPGAARNIPSAVRAFLACMLFAARASFSEEHSCAFREGRVTHLVSRW